MCRSCVCMLARLFTYAHTHSQLLYAWLHNRWVFKIYASLCGIIYTEVPLPVDNRISMSSEDTVLLSRNFQSVITKVNLMEFGNVHCAM